jgi:hypothetical protein
MFVDGLPEVLAFLLSETIPHSNKNGSLMHISAIKMHKRAENGHKLSIDAGLAMSIRRNDSRAMVGRICVFDQDSCEALRPSTQNLRTMAFLSFSKYLAKDTQAA